MKGEGEKLALILNTASYERVAFALNAAIAAAAAGQDVALLFGYGALARLRKGCSDEVGEETVSWLRGRINSGLEKGSIPRISQLLEILLKLGGKIYACPAAMALHNLARTELTEQVDQVCSLAEFLRRDASAASVLYI